MADHKSTRSKPRRHSLPSPSQPRWRRMLPTRSKSRRLSREAKTGDSQDREDYCPQEASPGDSLEKQKQETRKIEKMAEEMQVQETRKIEKRAEEMKIKKMAEKMMQKKMADHKSTRSKPRRLSREAKTGDSQDREDG